MAREQRPSWVAISLAGDDNGTNSPCIDVQGGAALIQACDFFDAGKPQLRVDAKAAGVTISGCRLQGGERFEIADEAKRNVQAGLNLTR